jgi:hypothetical protein
LQNAWNDFGNVIAEDKKNASVHVLP